ncbi:autotransporter outer membrane beta-barrel domain-containing protein [Pantoea allii]|uniref:autotransporter outer membrane beta-barrel domain-containing protein n=1 Tax=Pantoea allii TaxID=574096 RepID=UPI00156056EA|nr:autotransporter outer membrane beta-barrel domain-containing protein [Pantoea allii]NQS84997.1 autotransporter outer membrane beta-barrel domain-containing protein [Pantoea allii]
MLGLFNTSIGTLSYTDNSTTGLATVYIDPTSTVGTFTNTATLAADYSVVNEGKITGDITNTGIMAPVLNTGTIGGNASLGKGTMLSPATLILAGSSASVAGTVSSDGTSGAAAGKNTLLAIGDADNTATLDTDSVGSAYVDNLSIASGSQLTVLKNNDWHLLSTGADAVSNAGTLVMNSGSTLAGNLTSTGTLTMSDEASASASIGGSLINSGRIVLNPTDHSAGNTLTINGNYTGTAGSSLQLGTVLGGDNSLTDLLNITGNASGQTKVYVTNENGAGAHTLEGIKVIAVGATSGADFSLGNRVVAGAYDYSLTGRADGYYLTSLYAPTPPTPLTPLTPLTPTVRPEVGSYTASLRAANTLFSFSLRDREGEQNFTGSSEKERAEPGIWMRNEGGYNSASTSDEQNHTDSSRYVLQMGGDLARWSTDGVNQFSLGLMGGYATQHSTTRNALTGYRSQADIHGYSTGAYVTWFQNAADKTGFYADSWMQYSWFNTQVKGDGLDAEHYDSRGLSASLESGYAMRVSQWKSTTGTENAVYIEPHAQAVWSGVNADSFSETNGTRVSGTGNDNLQLRLGARTYLNGKSRYDRDTYREFQPFVEANWIYNTQQYGVRMNDVVFRAAGDRNVGELKTGVEARLGERFSGWVAIAQQMGGSGYADTTGSLGVRYTF